MDNIYAEIEKQELLNIIKSKDNTINVLTMQIEDLNINFKNQQSRVFKYKKENYLLREAFYALDNTLNKVQKLSDELQSMLAGADIDDVELCADIYIK